MILDFGDPPVASKCSVMYSDVGPMVPVPNRTIRSLIEMSSRSANAAQMYRPNICRSFRLHVTSGTAILGVGLARPSATKDSLPKSAFGSSCSKAGASMANPEFALTLREMRSCRGMTTVPAINAHHSPANSRERSWPRHSSRCRLCRDVTQTPGLRTKTMVCAFPVHRPASPARMMSRLRDLMPCMVNRRAFTIAAVGVGPDPDSDTRTTLVAW